MAGAGSRFLLVAAVLAGAGCGGSAPPCSPGESQACTCPGGLVSAQTCGDDGTFAACACDRPDLAMPPAGDDAAVADDAGDDAGDTPPVDLARVDSARPGADGAGPGGDGAAGDGGPPDTGFADSATPPDFSPAAPPDFAGVDFTGCGFPDAGAATSLAWTRENGGYPPVDRAINALWGAGPGDFWSAGEAGQIGHSTDGVSWDLQSLPAGYTSLRAVWGSGPTDLWAAGTDLKGNETILHGNGKQWSAVAAQLSAGQVSTLGGSSPTDVYVGYTGGFAITHYDGNAWTPGFTPSLGGINHLWAADAKTIWAVGPAGYIGFSTGDGKWATQMSGTGADLYGIWGSSAGDVYAVGDGGVILHSFGIGDWSAMNSNSKALLTGVWGRSKTDVYAVGHGGTVLHNPGNVNWVPQPSGTLSDLAGVYVAPAGGHVVAAGRTVAPSPLAASVAWSAGDGTWSPGDLTPELRAIAAPDPTHLFAVGARGAVLASRGDGIWLPQASGTTRDLNGVYAADATHVWAVGDAATILRSDGAGTWNVERTDPNLGALQAIWGADAGALSAAGAGLFFTSGGDGVWTRKMDGQSVMAIWGTTRADVYYAGDALAHSGKPELPGLGFGRSALGGAAGSIWVAAAFGLTLRSHGDGCWLPVPTGAAANLSGLWSDGTTVFVGAGQGILHSAGGAFVSEPIPLAAPGWSTVRVGGAVYAVAAGGVILRGK